MSNANADVATGMLQQEDLSACSGVDAPQLHQRIPSVDGGSDSEPDVRTGTLQCEVARATSHSGSLSTCHSVCPDPGERAGGG